MLGETAPTSVTSSPSRIQMIPSAPTTSQWNRLHGSRSRRAGAVVSTMSDAEAGASKGGPPVSDNG